mmetsp:Transcript_195/g.453  ORF Transcript_195/g.453 Transcript_195/m.453 type:complete len:221 (-) Transcript_195:838-1500(-)
MAQSMPSDSRQSSCCMVQGMSPPAPTPTGMFLNKASASLSLTPSSPASSSVRLVRISLTPQLMSNPTPPGLIIAAGSSMSNAATFPMQNPYPECTSGIARLAPTIPGRAATLAACRRAGMKEDPPVCDFGPQQESWSSWTSRDSRSSLTMISARTFMFGTNPTSTWHLVQEMRLRNVSSSSMERFCPSFPFGPPPMPDPCFCLVSSSPSFAGAAAVVLWG